MLTRKMPQKFIRMHAQFLRKIQNFSEDGTVPPRLNPPRPRPVTASPCENSGSATGCLTAV